MHWRSTIFLLSGAATLLAGCYRRSDMAEQPKFWKVYRPSRFFLDGQSARELPEGVLAIENLRTDREYFYARDTNGRLIEHFPAHFPDGAPFPQRGSQMRALLHRGQERFNIYCVACHGALGYGDGMVVQRGFTTPPSYHDDKLLHRAPVGHFYDVISNGYGAMFGFADRISPDDRWAIVAYVKALQLSQSPTESDVQNAKLEQGSAH